MYLYVTNFKQADGQTSKMVNAFEDDYAAASYFARSFGSSFLRRATVTCVGLLNPDTMDVQQIDPCEVSCSDEFCQVFERVCFESVHDGVLFFKAMSELGYPRLGEFLKTVDPDFFTKLVAWLLAEEERATQVLGSADANKEVSDNG